MYPDSYFIKVFSIFFSSFFSSVLKKVFLIKSRRGYNSKINVITIRINGKTTDFKVVDNFRKNYIYIQKPLTIIISLPAVVLTLIMYQCVLHYQSYMCLYLSKIEHILAFFFNSDISAFINFFSFLLVYLLDV